MSETYETTWWEYVRDDDGKIVYGPWRGAVSSPVLRNITTGEELSQRDLPVGALWAVERHGKPDHDAYPPCGKDGKSIVCITIDGYWNIDGKASNCTLPQDFTHRCWVRHGTVGDKLTVDKNGHTCQAGAGSFFMGRNNEWHGFLREGKLTPC